MQEDRTRVRVMSDREKTDYRGVTVNAGGDDESGRYKKSGDGYRRYGFRAHTANIPFGRVYTFGMGNRWLTRLAIVIIGSAILAFLVLVALPVAIICAAIGMLIYIVLTVLRGK